jgi:hypothetical protein
MSGSYFVLDSSGTAYAQVLSSEGIQGIARFTQGAPEAVIVYSEKNRPAGAGWNNWPAKLYNMMNGGWLVTGP